MAKSVTTHPNLVIGDACEISLQDSSVDFVITSQVIEHVRDDKLMSEEIYRVLSRGGTAYISTVYKKWYGWYFYRCNGKWRLDPTHVREYSHDSELVSVLEKSGLEVFENVKTLDSRPIMDSILRRIGASRRSYNNPILRKLRSIRIPIPGYFIWELVCRKN